MCIRDSHEPGDFFPIGSTTVMCTVKDVAGNQGATAFVITVKSKITAPTVIPTTVSLDLAKFSYGHDDAIFVTGTAKPIIDGDVMFEIRDSLDNLVGLEHTDVGKSNKYDSVIFPSALWSANGTYSMTALYGISKDTEKFEFFPSIVEEPVSTTTSIATQLNLCLLYTSDAAEE